MLQKPTKRCFFGLLAGGLFFSPSLCAQSRGKIPLKPGEKLDLTHSLDNLKPSPPPVANPAPASEPGSPPPQSPTRPVPAAQMPAQSTPVPPPLPVFSDLEVQAAIYTVAGLPEVFTEAVLAIPDPVDIELCDSLGFVRVPQPISFAWWIRSEGKKELSGEASFTAGFGHIQIPAEYAGGLLQIRSTRPLIAYRCNAADRMVFGMNRRNLLRSEGVTLQSGARRVKVIQRPNLRMDILPLTPDQIQANPQTRVAWESFLSMATKP